MTLLNGISDFIPLTQIVFLKVVSWLISRNLGLVAAYKETGKY